MNIKLLKLFQVWVFLEHSKKSYKFWFTVLLRAIMVIFVFVIPPIAQFLYVVKIMRAGKPEIQEVASV